MACGLPSPACCPAVTPTDATGAKRFSAFSKPRRPIWWRCWKPGVPSPLPFATNSSLPLKPWGGIRPSPAGNWSGGFARSAANLSGRAAATGTIQTASDRHERLVAESDAGQELSRTGIAGDPVRAVRRGEDCTVLANDDKGPVGVAHPVKWLVGIINAEIGRGPVEPVGRVDDGADGDAWNSRILSENHALARAGDSCHRWHRWHRWASANRFRLPKGKCAHRGFFPDGQMPRGDEGYWELRIEN